ncbi:MAG: hypothetical protein FD163_2169 [Hyphomonadaceae bacterium]|nr:MAG: hypothetical protein FD163_2169 [Hyphomonadaceae bacterium]
MYSIHFVSQGFRERVFAFQRHNIKLATKAALLLCPNL